MNVDEKIDYLMHVDESSELLPQDLMKIVALSYDEDEFVRSQVAVALVHFDEKLARETLLRLASDEDSMVRTEAYDSLSVYVNKDVLVALENAIKTEEDEIACSYAIMSWTDILRCLKENIGKKLEFICEIKKIDKIKNSEHCMLSCCRAQYLFGYSIVFKEVVDFLKSDDYHIRYSAVGVLEEIAQKNIVGDIEKELQLLLLVEESQAVLEKAREILEQLSIEE